MRGKRDELRVHRVAVQPLILSAVGHWQVVASVPSTTGWATVTKSVDTRGSLPQADRERDEQRNR